MARTAIVLFNLGGPDGPRAVRPFLFNLFNDPAIIAAPGPLRWLLAQWISRRRAPVARRIYDELGGSSPLLANTEAQAYALEAALNAQAGGNAETGGNTQAEGGEVKAFIAMRYWHPMSEETARAVKAYDPERIVLLPLYPQFSTTTTGSSIAAWAGAAARAGLEVPTRTLCCYPSEPGFVAEVAGQLRSALGQAGGQAAGHGAPRVLFSAHGLPKKIVERGDPYQWQIERTAAAVVEALGQVDLGQADLGQADLGQEGLDWRICYQSRVGPLEWIGPSTEAEIARAGRDGVALVVVPIAFVSEHSETLVELDIEYRRLARVAGVPAYVRAPTVGTGAAFIAGLAGLVRQALADKNPGPLRSQAGGRLCPSSCSGCPHGR